MSKLKRKLDNAFDGQLPSNLKLNENFCLIGTPLPPLEKSKDTGEFVPLWKQEVRDEKGRRRLHGAFTGGFSAGYFNSVGSKEGWTPTTFISSRNERATHKAARPEDFMDDEDLAEMREAQKLVDTTEEMDLTGGTQAELSRRAGDTPKDEISVALEEALLPTARDSVGARILKKMGWRPGQGVGPRITWAQLKAQDASSSSTDLTKSSVSEHEEASKHTYAPRDTKLPVFVRKTNSHGIGYSHGATLHDSLNAAAKSGPAISSGFGLGALNDADEDDIDIYDSSTGDARGNRVAYDIKDADEEERPTIGPPRLKTSQSSRLSNAGRGDVTLGFQDGRYVISGFVISSSKVSEDLVWPIPNIPAGWKPDPSRVWKADSSVSATPVPAPSRDGNWKNTITAEQRGSMLGETPLPAAPRSVFDYLAPKDRERLRAMADGLVGAAPPPPVDIVVPNLETRVAQAALKGFQPFASDPAKQMRYTAYLSSQADGEPLALTPKPGQGNAGFNQELAEYANAAKIFRPVSGAMASRFTTAAVVESGPKSVEGLHQPSKDSSYLTTPSKGHAEEKIKLEDPPKVQAAKAGMFGPLTRESEPWYPARLLCKRFGVPDPHPDGAAAEAAAQAKKDKETQFEQETKRLAADAAAAAATPSADGEPAKSGEGRRHDLSNVGLGDDETQGRDTLTYERPAMDIFKAIFASDDEDSENEGDNDGEAGAGPGPPDGALKQPRVQEPQPLPPAASVDEPVDLTSFRPTFVSKTPRQVTTETRKRDKGKKPKSKFALVSFGDEDAETIEGPAAPPDGNTEAHHKKKKKRREKKKDEDEAMWVEKDVPDVVKTLDASTTTDGASRGRKRAIDFM